MDRSDRARLARIGPLLLIALAAIISAPASDLRADNPRPAEMFKVPRQNVLRPVIEPTPFPSEPAAKPATPSDASSAKPSADSSSRKVERPAVTSEPTLASPADEEAKPAVREKSPTTEKAPPDSSQSAAKPSSPRTKAKADPAASAPAVAPLDPTAVPPLDPANTPAGSVGDPSTGIQPANQVSTDESLPWGPSIPSPELDAVARRAEEITREGFNLAERGALFTARARFIDALRTLAQALDAQKGTNAHTRALAAGLRTMEEVDDFVPRGERLETDLAFRVIIDSHRTPVLKGRSIEGLTASEAQRAYLTYAQEQLAAGGGDQSVASLALHGMGKICSVPAAMHGPQTQIAEAKAVAYHQAALIIDPRNFLAANELGVLLVRCGRLDDARLALEHAVRASNAPAPWKNLASVYQRLGDQERSEKALQEAKAAVAKLEKSGRVGVTGKYPIQWVDTDTFAQRNSMMFEPPPPPHQPEIDKAESKTVQPAAAAAAPSDKKSWSSFFRR